MVEEYKNVLSLKVDDSNLNAKALMCLHKATGKTISEIKLLSENGEPIYKCTGGDTQGIVLLNEIKHTLIDLGYEIKCFLNDLQVESKVFDNMEKRYIEIDSE